MNQHPQAARTSESVAPTASKSGKPARLDKRRLAPESVADLDVGDTACLETCATKARCFFIPHSSFLLPLAVGSADWTMFVERAKIEPAS
jgi:hypothetical protein